VLTATLTAFRADLRDDIYSVVAPGTTRVYSRRGETAKDGLEMALRLEQGAFEVEAGYAYTRAYVQGNSCSRLHGLQTAPRPCGPARNCRSSQPFISGWSRRQALQW